MAGWLAVVTAVNNASTGADGSPQALLDGFHAALGVSLVVAVLGVVAATPVLRRRTVAAPADSPEVAPATETALEEAA